VAGDARERAHALLAVPARPVLRPALRRLVRLARRPEDGQAQGVHALHRAPVPERLGGGRNRRLVERRHLARGGAGARTHDPVRGALPAPAALPVRILQLRVNANDACRSPHALAQWVLVCVCASGATSAISSTRSAMHTSRRIGYEFFYKCVWIRLADVLL
jgi:hypothetical protein